MFSCSTYLRVYEPLTAFQEEESRRWAAYAASPDRPRRAQALAAEQADALRRLLALPPVAAPERESGDAYVRWAGGVTYICPWQTRLRSWLALASLVETVPPVVLSAAFPTGCAEAAAAEFARWQGDGPSPSLRVHIQASTWSVPLEWFVPFAADERWLVLDAAGDHGNGGRTAGPAEPTLLYATGMAQARRRVSRAIAILQRAGDPVAGPFTPPGPDEQVLTGLEDVGRWLEEFHPHALVELDYGGLAHLLDGESLKADQSVAEMSTAIGALAAGEAELATAMHRRLTSRWQALEALALAS